MRANGYYWIQLEDDTKWQPAEFEDGVWWVIGSGDKWPEHEIHASSKIEYSN